MHRKFLSAILFFAVIFTACVPHAAPTVTVTPVPPTVAVVETRAPSASAQNFDAARAFEANRKLAVDIGKRVAGTPGGANAADYIASEFAKGGLEVTRQPFAFDGWEDRGTTVQMLAPETKPLEVQALQYSPGGQVEGEIVLVPGVGNRNDFAQVNVRDKIALVKRGTLPFSEKAANAEQAGASAVLIYNNEPPIFTGTLRERVKIPVIALSGATGDGILKLLANGAVRASIQSDTAIVQRTGTNVIGTLRGKTDATIVVGGHYDSVNAGPGAGDNASGTATLIELARVMGAKPQPQHTLVFIAFDAEESGLLGSRAYVDALSNAQIGKLRGMLNFDMLGAGSGPLLLMGNGDVALLARSSAKQLGIDAYNGALPANAGSDHESFARRGVDTVFFMRDYRLLHTPDDTIDQIKPEYLGEAGRVAQRVLERLDATPAQ
ncbi:MAG: M20/M25/M40 family metallo-hydrolase [Chloroflexi bacterium]|nr:M20/M25/M40 family metallo-hydrolase [Chloroflexota bacterium]